MTQIGFFVQPLDTLSGVGSYQGEFRVFLNRQDPTANTSTIGWEFGIRKLTGSGRWSATSNLWTVSIAGNVVQSGDKQYNFDTVAHDGVPGMGSWIVVANGEVPVANQPDGSLSTLASAAWADTSNNLQAFQIGLLTGPGLPVTTLPRATVATITPNPVIEGDPVTISLPRANGSFTHDVTWSSGSLSGTIGTGLGTNTTWTPPGTIAAQWPGKSEYPITITVVTKNSGVAVGTTTSTLIMRPLPAPPEIGGEKFPFDLRVRKVEFIGGEWGPTEVVPVLDLNVVDPHSATSTCEITTSDLVSEFEDYSIVDVEVHNGVDWVNPGLRFELVRVEDDTTDLSQTSKYSGTNFIDYSLARAYTQAKATWLNNTPGSIMAYLIDSAKSRGWGPRIEKGFAPLTTTLGDAWRTATPKELAPGVPTSQVLEGLVSDGLAEYRTRFEDDTAYLDLFNPGTGFDWTVPGADPIVNFALAPISRAPRRGTSEGRITRITVAGDAELQRTRERPAFDTNVRGQLEGWLAASGVTVDAEADRLGDNALTEGAAPTDERTFEFSPHAVPRHFWPYFTIRPGDWVLIPKAQGVGTDRVRVGQITLSKSGEDISITVLTGERILSGTGALARRQQIATGGAIPGGNLTNPATLDDRIPAAPTITSITSAGYWDSDGAAKAEVTVNTTAVTTSITGSAIEVDYYELWWRPNVGTGWALVTVSEDLAIETPGWGITQSVQFRVRARSTAGNFGQWSAFDSHTTTAPAASLAAPSVLSVSANALGIIKASWSGLIGGAAAPAHLAHVRAEISQNNTAPWSTFGTPMVSAGSTSIDPGLYRQWYLRLVPVDRLGQDGTASSGVAITTVDPKVDPRVPKAPTGLAATTGGSWSTNGLKLASWVNLTWTAVTQDVASTTLAIAGYRVWGRLSSETNMREITVSEVNSLRINDLDPGAAWVYEVEAISHTSISSAPSSTVSITTTATNLAMATPIGVTATSTKGLLRVAWNGLLTGSIQPPNQFRYAYVEYKTTSGGSWTRAGTTLPRGGGDVVIPNLTIGTAYIARLTVVDGVNVESAKSADTSSVTIVGVDTGDLTSAVTTVINSKAKITYATTAPVGSGTSVGDTWFQRDGDVLVGQWDWSGSAWVARAMSNLSATAIDGKVVTGATVQTVAGNSAGIKLTGNIFVAYDTAGLATFLLNGDTGEVYFADGIISGDALVDGTIFASKLDVGSVVASLIASDLGESLNLESNESVNIVVGNAVAGVQSDVDGLDSNLTLMQTYYQFGADGAVITKPGSPFAVRIANDRIEMIANGIVVSYWTAGSMVVPSLVANDTAVIGAHQWRKEGTRTVVRAL